MSSTSLSVLDKLRSLVYELQMLIAVGDISGAWEKLLSAIKIGEKK